jgi:hypothetical protein
MDKDGRQCTSQVDIENAFVQYYQELFTKREELEVAACVEALDRKVTRVMNQRLLAEFSIDQITFVLNQMPPLKAPSPDGFPASFFQHNWATIHNEVSTIIFHFLNSGVLDDTINETHIAHVPKKNLPCECY